MTYIVLTGAKKNVGDYLITKHCVDLLKHIRPERELVQKESWKPLELTDEERERAKAIIILGGPGYQPKMYPHVYPLVDNLSALGIPIVPFSLGWKGFPGDFATTRRYRFTDASLELLRYIERTAPVLACRDVLTVEALERNGITNTVMTGDPVWYHIPSLGKKLQVPGKIRTIAFTPAQNALYEYQSIRMLDVLRGLFPDARIICAFHRGIRSDDRYTPTVDEKRNRRIADAAKERGCELLDLSFSPERLEAYAECDLHVGYRVHGHLYFVSRRKPSLLIEEDGRGVSLSESLNHAGIRAFARAPWSGIAERSLSASAAWISPAVAGIEPSPYAPAQLRLRLRMAVDAGFAPMQGYPYVIDSQYEVMKRFLESLP
jgi:hypothetical protein